MRVVPSTLVESWSRPLTRASHGRVGLYTRLRGPKARGFFGFVCLDSLVSVCLLPTPLRNHALVCVSKDRKQVPSTGCAPAAQNNTTTCITLPPPSPHARWHIYLRIYITFLCFSGSGCLTSLTTATTTASRTLASGSPYPRSSGPSFCGLERCSPSTRSFTGSPAALATRPWYRRSPKPT